MNKPDKRVNPKELLQIAGQPARDEIDRLIAGIDPDFRPCLVYLRENLFERGLKITDLKDKADRRGYELSKVFRRLQGQRPTRFISEKRLETACRLLRDTELPIGTIARSVGFTGIHAFGMRFRQEVGQPASEYRASHRDTQLD